MTCVYCKKRGAFLMTPFCIECSNQLALDFTDEVHHESRLLYSSDCDLCGEVFFLYSKDFHGWPETTVHEMMNTCLACIQPKPWNSYTAAQELPDVFEVEDLDP